MSYSTTLIQKNILLFVTKRAIQLHQRKKEKAYATKQYHFNQFNRYTLS